jgi:excisionase family DNA binding protein
MHKPAQIEPLFLRVSAAAVALNMSPASIYELIRRGILPAVKIGGKTRIAVRALNDLVEKAMAIKPRDPVVVEEVT